MAYAAQAHSFLPILPILPIAPEFPGFEPRELISVSAARRVKVKPIINSRDIVARDIVAKTASSKVVSAKTRPNLALVQFDHPHKPLSLSLSLSQSQSAKTVTGNAASAAVEGSSLFAPVTAPVHWFNNEAGEFEQALWRASWLVLGLLSLLAI